MPERWSTWAALALVATSAACSLPPYEPMPVAKVDSLPPDAFARCAACLRVRYQRLLEADEKGFRLQTDWAPGDDPTEAKEQRASVFVHAGEVACVVEVRYLGFGWFASLPSWSSPRPDPWLEEELAKTLEQALSATAAAKAPAAAGG